MLQSSVCGSLNSELLIFLFMHLKHSQTRAEEEENSPFLLYLMVDSVFWTELDPEDSSEQEETVSLLKH